MENRLRTIHRRSADLIALEALCDLALEGRRARTIRHVGTSTQVLASPGVFEHRRGTFASDLTHNEVLRQLVRSAPPVVMHPTSTVSTVGRMVDIDDLVDATEIARRLGVKRPQVVHDWRRRHDDFPEPVALLGNAHVWLWPDVEKWARTTGRAN